MSRFLLAVLAHGTHALTSWQPSPPPPWTTPPFRPPPPSPPPPPPPGIYFPASPTSPSSPPATLPPNPPPPPLEQTAGYPPPPPPPTPPPGPPVSPPYEGPPLAPPTPPSPVTPPPSPEMPPFPPCPPRTPPTPTAFATAIANGNNECQCSIYFNGATPRHSELCQKEELPGKVVCSPTHNQGCNPAAGFTKCSTGPTCENLKRDEKCDRKATFVNCRNNKKVAKKCQKSCYEKGFGVMQCGSWSSIKRLWRQYKKGTASPPPLSNPSPPKPPPPPLPADYRRTLEEEEHKNMVL